MAPIGGVALESSHNGCSGHVLRPSYVESVKKLTKKHKTYLYLDGARAWNAAIFLQMDLKEMCANYDLISVCLSKGLGCPIGSVMIGSHKDIARARNLRKLLGGAMR